MEDTDVQVKADQGQANGGANFASKRAKLGHFKERNLSRRKSLSRLVNLPLDILGEIFKVLSPRDLVNLSNTSLMFRRTLTAKSADYIWRASREAEEAPQRPSDMAERDWAILLFCSICMGCGSNRAKHADFAIRRRLCKLCRQTKLVPKRKVANVDPVIFDLIPFTQTDGRNYLHEKHFYREDIKAMKNKLTLLRKRSGRRESRDDELSAFKARQQQQILEIAKALKLLIDWQNAQNELRSQQSDDAFGVRYEEVKRRFGEIGYGDVDFDDVGPSLRMHRLVRQKHYLTERSWERIRETFQPIMDENRMYVAEIAVKKLRASRRDIVERLYAKWKLSRPPHLWKYLPSVFNICRLAPFVPLIEADASITLTETHFHPAMETLCDLIPAAFEVIRSQLLRDVLAAHHPAHDAARHTDEFQKLQLATMIFRCDSCFEYLSGFDSVKAHNCAPDIGLSWSNVEAELPSYGNFPYPFSFLPQGASVTAQVLNVAGLDPLSTTTSQLSEQDCAYQCVQCGPMGKLHVAQSWMSFVFHALRKHAPLIEAGRYSGCRLVPQEYMPLYRRWRDNMSHIPWSVCTRCTKFLIGKERATYAQIVDHLFRCHNISNPKINVDFLKVEVPNFLIQCFYTEKVIQRKR